MFRLLFIIAIPANAYFPAYPYDIGAYCQQVYSLRTGLLLLYRIVYTYMRYGFTANGSYQGKTENLLYDLPGIDASILPVMPASSFLEQAISLNTFHQRIYPYNTSPDAGTLLRDQNLLYTINIRSLNHYFQCWRQYNFQNNMQGNRH